MDTRKKLLIIEDEEAVIKLLKDKFLNEGFDVKEARNGVEGLKKAKKEKPDVILLDIIMPKMDGLSMLKELRKDAWGKDAKVIILTNLSDSEDLAAAMENKAYDFLVKSEWKLNDVVKKVKEKIK